MCELNLLLLLLCLCLLCVIVVVGASSSCSACLPYLCFCCLLHCCCCCQRHCHLDLLSLLFACCWLLRCNCLWVCHCVHFPPLLAYAEMYVCVQLPFQLESCSNFLSMHTYTYTHMNIMQKRSPRKCINTSWQHHFFICLLKLCFCLYDFALRSG